MSRKEEKASNRADRRTLTSALKLIAVELCELAKDFLLILHSDASSGINHFHSQNTHGIHPDLTHPSRAVLFQLTKIDEKYHSTLERILEEFLSVANSVDMFTFIVPSLGVNLT